MEKLILIRLPSFILTCIYIVRWLLQCLSGKETPCNSGDTGNVGLIPGLGRSPGGENDNPLQYSCLEKHMDRRDW